MRVFTIKDKRPGQDNIVASIHTTARGAIAKAITMIPAGGIPRFLVLRTGSGKGIFEVCGEAEAITFLENYGLIRVCHVPPTPPGVEMFATDDVIIQGREVSDP